MRHPRLQVSILLLAALAPIVKGSKVERCGSNGVDSIAEVPIGSPGVKAAPPAS